MAEDDPAVDRDDATDACAKDQADHRSDPPTRAEAKLGEPERAGIVDEGDRDPERRPDARPDRLTGPATGQVRQKRGPAGRRFVQPRHPDSDRRDRGPPRDRGPREPDHPVDDSVRAIGAVGRDLSFAERPPGAVDMLDGTTI